MSRRSNNIQLMLCENNILNSYNYVMLLILCTHNALSQARFNFHLIFRFKLTDQQKMSQVTCKWEICAHEKHKYKLSIVYI